MDDVPGNWKKMILFKKEKPIIPTPYIAQQLES